MSKLFEVTIEVTQRCPNRCIYCSSWSGPDKTEALDFKTICQIADDAATMGAQLINLSGGEPLLRQDIVEITDYIHSKGLKIRLYTSGIIYDGGFRTIPHELLQSLLGKVDFLIFNYEASSLGLYAKIMGTMEENLGIVEESIHNAISLGFTVEAHIVPMKCNFRQIPATLERLYDMGVSKVSILRLVPQGREQENEGDALLTEDEQVEFKSLIDKLSNQYDKKQLRLGKPYRSGKYNNCNTGTIRLAVRYDGFVYPCGAFKDGMDEYKGCSPDNVNEKRLAAIYETSAYIAKVREDLDTYYDGEVREPCFGQYCRSIYS